MSVSNTTRCDNTMCTHHALPDRPSSGGAEVRSTGALLLPQGGGATSNTLFPLDGAPGALPCGRGPLPLRAHSIYQETVLPGQSYLGRTSCPGAIAMWESIFHFALGKFCSRFGQSMRFRHSLIPRPPIPVLTQSHSQTSNPSFCL